MQTVKKPCNAATLVSMPSVVKSMFDQMELLVRLLLTNPASSAEAERRFSSLRRVKTDMRSYLIESILIIAHFCTSISISWMPEALDIDGIVSLLSNVTRGKQHSDELSNSQTEQMFQIDI
jgi:hypothetical protein